MTDAADEVTMDDISHDTWGNGDLLRDALLSMAFDRRIALARELLEGTGWTCVFKATGRKVTA